MSASQSDRSRVASTVDATQDERASDGDHLQVRDPANGGRRILVREGLGELARHRHEALVQHLGTDHGR
jgi:hypothetical protein